MNIAAIIQARMGSTRLPEKILMDIEGKPMLWHLINRLKYSKVLTDIVVATSRSDKDDIVEEFCRNQDVSFYRGSEEDVLDRYYQAGKVYQTDVVVRITADCPLIDPVVLDKVINGYLSNMDKFDGANNTICRTYPRGLDVEVIAFSILEQGWRDADKDYQREHVMIYFYEHPEAFSFFSVESERNLSHFRWTVDESADLELVRKFYQRLYKKKTIFLMQDIFDLLEEEPALIEINKHIEQKKR